LSIGSFFIVFRIILTLAKINKKIDLNKLLILKRRGGGGGGNNPGGVFKIVINKKKKKKKKKDEEGADQANNPFRRMISIMSKSKK